MKVKQLKDLLINFDEGLDVQIVDTKGFRYEIKHVTDTNNKSFITIMLDKYYKKILLHKIIDLLTK